jgi:hypothetical protein
VEKLAELLPSRRVKNTYRHHLVSYRLTWPICDDSKTPARFQGDIDGFVAGSEGMVADGTNAIHSICPVEVHLNGTKALTESTGSISIRLQHGGEAFECISYNRFISRLELVGDEWKLLSLEAIYIRDFITPVIPERTASFDFPENSRESYKCISWVLSQKGFTIKQDLPGADDPTSCAKFMDANFTWLNK